MNVKVDAGRSSVSGRWLVAVALVAVAGAGLTACNTGCLEERQAGDGGQANDFCWSPPEHWCASGMGGALTLACDADRSLCCSFPTTCIPCGWTSCWESPTPAFCGTAEPDAGRCAALGPIPDPEPICVDRFD